jgi:hypothetical protein
LSRQKRGCPIFLEIYRGRGSSNLPEGSDLAAPKPRRRRKLPPSSPRLLLGIGGGLSITIINKIRTISIIITVIHFDPLVV